jgi:hypothetical protein
VTHGPTKRTLISFDYPGSTFPVRPFGHRMPKTSALSCQHHSVVTAQSGAAPTRAARDADRCFYRLTGTTWWNSSRPVRYVMRVPIHRGRALCPMSGGDSNCGDAGDEER